MEIEDIAKLDLFIRNNSGLKNLLNIDNLIIVDKENKGNPVEKLKKSASELLEFENSLPDDIKLIWKELFKQQIRFSVDRTKQQKK